MGIKQKLNQELFRNALIEQTDWYLNSIESVKTLFLSPEIEEELKTVNDVIEKIAKILDVDDQDIRTFFVTEECSQKEATNVILGKNAFFSSPIRKADLSNAWFFLSQTRKDISAFLDSASVYYAKYEIFTFPVSQYSLNPKTTDNHVMKNVSSIEKRKELQLSFLFYLLSISASVYGCQYGSITAAKEKVIQNEATRETKKVRKENEKMQKKLEQLQTENEALKKEKEKNRQLTAAIDSLQNADKEAKRLRMEKYELSKELEALREEYEEYKQQDLSNSFCYLHEEIKSVTDTEGERIEENGNENRNESENNEELPSLPEKNVVFAGGHINLTNKLRELYPKWSYITKETSRSTFPTNPSCIFVWYKHMSHSTFNNVVEFYKSPKSFIYLESSNIEKLDQEMKKKYADFLKKKKEEEYHAK